MTDWASIAPAVAVELLGEPSTRTAREFRWGRKGSFSLDRKRGRWFDHSSGKGGGVLDLVQRERACDKARAVRWLQEQGYVADDDTPHPQAHTPTHRRPTQYTKPEPKNEHPKPEPKNEHPRLWDKAVKPDDTPARSYLTTARWCWPPAGEHFPELPAAVRWLPRQAWELERWPWLRVPTSAAGAVLFAYRDRGGELRAVSLEALDFEGGRLERRWRRTFGSRDGAAFRPVPRPEASKVVIVEGEVTALAAFWLYPQADALALGGTSGVRSWAPWDERPILVCPDGDGAGDEAARAPARPLGP